MKVKWQDTMSSERKLNGGNPQGSTFGIWQYLGSSNDNANVVPADYRFKFVDDLSVLENINLLASKLITFLVALKLFIWSSTFCERETARGENDRPAVPNRCQDSPQMLLTSNANFSHYCYFGFDLEVSQLAGKRLRTHEFSLV